MNAISNREVNYEQLELLEAIEKDMGMVPDFSRVYADPPSIFRTILGIDGAATNGALNSQLAIEMDFHTISLHFAV